jgi:hypothetical protein
MGKSAGNWIKTVIFRKKSYKSSFSNVCLSLSLSLFSLYLQVHVCEHRQECRLVFFVSV